MPPKVNPTHFHPTTPQASSKSMASRTLPGRASRFQKTNAPPAPPGETPQEKVKRLREAAARAKEAKISSVDRFLIKGRVWADKAHRITVFTLMGFTGIATIVTIYALTDMMRYNRKKKAEWLIEQKQLHRSKTDEAREAVAFGTATPEQIEFLRMEEKLDKWEEERSKRPGLFKRGTNWLLGGLSKEDVGSRKEGESEILKAVEDRKEEVGELVGEKKADFVESARMAWDKEKKLQEQGGMLDQLGTATATNEEKPKSGGWTSWMSRG